MVAYNLATRTFSLPLQVSDPDKHHGTCVTHVPWCMPGSLISGFLCSQWRGNVPGIPSACATRNLAYLVKGPWCWPSPPAQYSGLNNGMIQTLCCQPIKWPSAGNDSRKEVSNPKPLFICRGLYESHTKSQQDCFHNDELQAYFRHVLITIDDPTGQYRIV